MVGLGLVDGDDGRITPEILVGSADQRENRACLGRGSAVAAGHDPFSRRCPDAS
jgi:hypothetical protein